MAIKIQIRRGLASEWSSANPILALGEQGLETDTRKVKFGDGITAWNSLPYSVDKSQIGLGNVDNTSDANKPISSATQSALDLKANSSDVYVKSDVFTKTESNSNFEPKNSNIQSHISNVSNPHEVTKTQIGLGNVPNVDATSRANHTGSQLASTISDFVTASQDAIISQTIVNNDTTHAPSVDAVHDALASEEAARIAVSNRVTDIENDYGVAGGLATLDNAGKISTSMLPGTVLEYKGTWDASTNTPTLSNGSGSNSSADAGHIYRVSVAGTVNFGAGNITFFIGDDVILSEGLEWQRAPGGSLVIAVNGFQGDVVLKSQDITMTSSVAGASDVQHALENVYSSVSSTMTDHVEAIDPHTQYLNVTRADDRYYTKSEVDAAATNTLDFANNYTDSQLVHYYTKTESDSGFEPKNANIQSHISNISNPHSVTKAQVGLGNVDNTSDSSKPISVATQSALDSKVDKIVGKGLSTEDFTTAEKSKLAGIDSGATANQTDAYLLSRANHTGTQLSSTISDFTSAVQAVTIDASKINGGNVSNLEFSYLNGVTSSIQTQIDSKVDKITGKGLSTEDYTTAEKSKLSGIQAGATANSTDAQLRDRSTHTGNETVLTFSEGQSASAPVSGTTILSRAYGNRNMMGEVPKYGTSYQFQPFIGKKSISYFQANAGATTSTVIGMAAPTATGTATARPIASTSWFSWVKRIGYVSAAAAGSSCGIRQTTVQYGLGNLAGTGGFHFFCRFAISDNALVSASRTFVGLTATTTALANAEPSTYLNMIGIGHDTTDANFQIMRNGASGTATKIDLGANFVKSANADFIDIHFFCAPNDSTVYYTASIPRTGAETSGSFNTTLPLNTVPLAWQVFRSNAATGSAVGIDVSEIYIEADY